jgi:RNA polymerase sigma-70 factor (ECF subfamily)
MKDISQDTIAKAANGDHAAFKEIYDVCSGFVYSVALRIVNNNTDAEEVTQEVFIKMHKSLKNFGFRSSFKTWLYRIATNYAINAYHRQVKERNRGADFEVASNTIATEAHPIDKEDQNKLLERLLKPLTGEQRACIILREIEGLSYQEIAATLKINLNTLKTRLKRAREAILVSSQREVIQNEL